MFTGIIEEVGTVRGVEKLSGGVRLRIYCPQSGPELKINDSVAVNGVCLTVITCDTGSFETVAVEETLIKTTTGLLRSNSRVNIELPLRFNDRLGGHLVLGHVDTVGEVSAIGKREDSWMFTIAIPQQFLHYIIPVGSIAVDGVSLTIARIVGNTVTISIIPHTMDHTIFGSYAVGSKVNIEFDLVGKYIERIMKHDAESVSGRKTITEQILKEHGY